MPQLMPLLWNVSVLMVIFIVFMVIYLYSMRDLNNLNMDNSYEIYINKVWMW